MRDASRREVVERALGTNAGTQVRRTIRKGVKNEDPDSLRSKMLRKAPTVWSGNQSIKSRLIQAGYDNPAAPMAYSLMRVVALFAFPLAALFVIPKGSFFHLVVGVVAAAIIGLLLPPFILRRRGSPDDRTRYVPPPDCLDLLVVCVEAGISLDAAILRVGRDMIYVHPALANEMLIVSRKSNAGMTREEALRGLWYRTGVEEVRTLVASLVQSDMGSSSFARGVARSRCPRRCAESAATLPRRRLRPLRSR